MRSSGTYFNETYFQRTYFWRDLLLTREELPIKTTQQHLPIFTIPIHPGLLEDDISLNPELAVEVFPLAAQDWYADLQSYVETLPEGRMKSWIEDVFLANGAECRLEDSGRYRMGLSGVWSSYYQVDPRGFADGLSISRDHGGSLTLPERGPLGPPTVIFTPEKLEEYAIANFVEGRRFATGMSYGRHNVDAYPGALFLRNWAIHYLNAAMTELGLGD